MDVTDHLKEAMTEDSVGTSPSKQRSTGRRVGHVARTPSAGIHVELKGGRDAACPRAQDSELLGSLGVPYAGFIVGGPLCRSLSGGSCWQGVLWDTVYQELYLIP